MALRGGARARTERGPKRFNQRDRGPSQPDGAGVRAVTRTSLARSKVRHPGIGKRGDRGSRERKAAVAKAVRGDEAGIGVVPLGRAGGRTAAKALDRAQAWVRVAPKPGNAGAPMVGVLSAPNAQVERRGPGRPRGRSGSRGTWFGRTGHRPLEPTVRPGVGAPTRDALRLAWWQGPVGDHQWRAWVASGTKRSRLNRCRCR